MIFRRIAYGLVFLLCGLAAWGQEPVKAEEPEDSLKESQAESLADSLIESAGLWNEELVEEVMEEAKSLVTKDSLTFTLPKVELYTPDPLRSFWLSLILPGAGQIYNHKYWKLPVVYGGFLGCVYALSWNGQMLRDYNQAYLDIMDDDPGTKSYEKMLPLGYSIAGREERFKDIFKRKKNYYRKYRDMSLFAFAGVYLISVLDAYIDAELSTFDISRDLGLKWEPTKMNEDNVLTRRFGVQTYGVQCSLTF